MSNGEAAHYTLLPFVRQGIGALVVGDNPEIRFRINNGSPLAVPIRLYGPGDITGFDPRVVVRVEPRALATDFESSYLPAIEFDRPDFPWLFSPPVETGGKLLPWICLIVVRRVDGVEVKPPVGDALPSLSCPAAELPDLRESWAWAHAQVLRGSDPLEQALTRRPELNVSRLLCPRRLEPDAQYLACVVPTFKAGVEAGLGNLVTGGPRELAWRSTDSVVSLPVYYHWEFRTGAAGDFETLARRIQPRVVPALAGRRDLDASAPGFGLPDAGVLGLEGVLRPARPRLTIAGRKLSGFQKKLQGLLNEPAARENATRRARLEPILSPPIYGRWQAGRPAIDADAPPWLRELNVDPRYRVAASFGALVVQQDQEQLMASAWEQLGEIQRANQLLRQAQVARGVCTAIHEKRLKHLQTSSPERLIQLTEPLHSRIRVDNGPRTLHGVVRASALPAAAIAPAFRRITRPRGPIARRMPARSGVPVIGRLASRGFSPAAARKPVDGMLTVDVAAEYARQPGATVGPAFVGLTPEIIRTRPVRSAPSRRPTPGGGRVVIPETSVRVRDALAREYEHFRKTTTIDDVPAKPELPLDTVASTIFERLSPERTIPTRLRDRLGPTATSPPAADDPLEPIMSRPEFPQPMYLPLQAISQDLVLPGLEHVPNDTVQVVEINRPFIEAYMAGLNHEMNRELLWREFPTDQRGTYFKRFWNVAGVALSAEPQGDIRPIDAWDAPLGENFPGTTERGVLVLLIRGELLRRYPGAIVYASKATRVNDRWLPAGEERQPRLRGGIDPDVVFVGFELTLDEALGRTDPDGGGWFFVIQEQPTEPRFGFETGSLAANLDSVVRWKDLTWDHLSSSHASDRGYLNVAGPLAAVEKDGMTWGRDAAHMASIALQLPFRIALHARILLQNE